MKKFCKNCSSIKIIKYGKRAGKQRFLCNNCGFLWELGKINKHKTAKNEKLLDEYVRNEAKYRQLSLTEKVSIPTIQKRIDSVEFEKNLGIY